MAIYRTRYEVEDHCELVKLIKEKLINIPQSSFTQSTIDTLVQSASVTPVQSTTDEFKSLVESHKDVLDVVRQCMLDLVKKLDLEPVLDHVIAADVLSEDMIDEYKQKNDDINIQQQQLNRWFLRKIVLKGTNKVIM